MRFEAEHMVPAALRRSMDRFDVPLSVCGPCGDQCEEDKKAMIKCGLERGLTQEQALEEYNRSLLDL